MEEMNGNAKSFFEGRLRLVLGIVLMLAVAWLWVSWLRGVFPFSSSGVVTAPGETERQVSEKDVIDSLTSSATSSPASSPAVLKSLTSSPAKTNAKPVDNTAVLDSLTSKK